MSVSAKELQKVAEDFRALDAEGRKAILHIMDRLLEADCRTDAESVQVMLEAARETGNARLIAVAEKRAREHRH